MGWLIRSLSYTFCTLFLAHTHNLHASFGSIILQWACELRVGDRRSNFNKTVYPRTVAYHTTYDRTLPNTGHRFYRVLTTTSASESYITLQHICERPLQTERLREHHKGEVSERKESWRRLDGHPLVEGSRVQRATKVEVDPEYRLIIRAHPSFLAFDDVVRHLRRTPDRPG